MERIAIIGASRGLGAQVSRLAARDCQVLGVARKRDRLALLEAELSENFSGFVADVSQDLTPLIEKLEIWQPTRLMYFAGGGPHGRFQERAWKDHEWAWRVTFLAAAQLVHAALKFSKPPRQIILCGSAVAETTADPNAASYCSAKHALIGLYRTLAAENPLGDVRLFSPGYLDTELLPKTASVRYKGVWNPESIAQEFWRWSLSDDRSGHRCYSSHPER